jgi:hypothetical protein
VEKGKKREAREQRGTVHETKTENNSEGKHKQILKNQDYYKQNRKQNKKSPLKFIPC